MSLVSRITGKKARVKKAGKSAGSAGASAASVAKIERLTQQNADLKAQLVEQKQLLAEAKKLLSALHRINKVSADTLDACEAWQETMLKKQR